MRKVLIIDGMKTPPFTLNEAGKRGSAYFFADDAGMEFPVAVITGRTVMATAASV
jgi:hypothetical protein